MCDCFHLAFPNWHAASSGTGAGRRLQGPEAATEDDSICEEPPHLPERERPRPQGSSPVEEYPEIEKYIDSDEYEAAQDPYHKSGSEKKRKKSGLGSMFEKRSTPKMSKLKEAHSPDSEVIVKTAKDGCAEGLIYGGGGKEGIFIREVVPESPASKSLKVKEGDQILSATVYFDNIPYEDAIQILEHAQAYKVKLCLKRKPDTAETEVTFESDVIPEEELCAPEMREQGKTKRRVDARISWPKFPTLGKGRKSRFTRSHSSSEADEQRKLELSPTTSDTESPIKSQDALKGKKKHKIKLSALKKRGHISSSEDQDTDMPTTGQISSDIHQTQESDILSPGCLESPSGDTPQVYVTKGVKVMEDVQLEQNNQTQTAQHKVELISIDSTLKTADLTVALADQESRAIKSPDGKKKKKERSELKMQILQKDKSHKKAKSSPKRLKTLGASFEVADAYDQPALDVNISTTGSETAQLEMSEECIVKITPISTEKTVDKGDPYERLLKSRTQLPKREDIEIPGMEDMSRRTKAKRIKEPKASITGHHEENQAETVQMSIDVDSVKEAVSKLPGFKLPKVDTSGMPIPEEITVIDANAQRISVKTPTKVVDNKAKHGSQFAKFDMAAPPEISKITVKLPKIPCDHLSSDELINETKADFKKIEKDHETPSKREDIAVPGKESGKAESILLVQKTGKAYGAEGIKLEYESTGAKEFEKKSKTKKTIPSIGISKPDIRIPDIGIDLPKKYGYEVKGNTEKTEKMIFLQDVGLSSTEMSESGGQIGGVICDEKIPEIDGIEYIDSVEGSPAKKDGGIRFKGIGVSFDAKPKTDISAPEVTVKLPELGDVTADTSVLVIDKDKSIKNDGADTKTLEKEGKGSKFKMPNVGLSIPKVKGPKIDLNLSKKDTHMKLQAPKAGVPEAPETDTTLGTVLVSTPQQKLEIEKPDLELKQLETENDSDGQRSKFKMPKFGIKMPKMRGPEFDVSSTKKGADIKLPEAKVEVSVPEADVTLETVNVSIPEPDVHVEKSEFEIKLPKTESDIDGQGREFKMPHLGIKMPTDISMTVCIPEQKMEVEKPKFEIKSMESESDTDGYGRKFKMPSFGIKMPKMKGPEFDLSLSAKDSDVKLPETKVEVKIPDVTENDVSLGHIAFSTPEQNAEVEKPDFKIKPLQTDGELEIHQENKFKMPKLGIKMPKIKGPEFDVSLPKKDTDVKLPAAKMEVKIPDAPETDVSHGNIDVPIPEPNVEDEKPEIEIRRLQIDGEVDVQGNKFTMPKLGIKMPKIKSPEFDLNLSKKGSDVKLPEAKFEAKVPEAAETDITLGRGKVSKIPEQNLEVEKPEFELKPPETEKTGRDIEGQGSKFTMPKFGIKMPKMNVPEINVSLSKKDVDVKLPEAKVDVKIPDTSETDVCLEHIDVSIPDQKIEVEKTDYKIKPLQTDDELDVEVSKIKMPKLGITLSKVKGSEIDLHFSRTEVDMTLSEAKAEVRLPDVELEESSTAVDMNIPDIQAPEIHQQGIEGDVKHKKTKFSLPRFSFSKSSVKSPEADVSQDVNVRFQEGEVELKGVEMDIKQEKDKVETYGQESKFKLPKFGISLPKARGAEYDLSASKKVIGVALPEAKAEVKLPKVELKKHSAKVEIETPEIKDATHDTEELQSKFQMPTVKLPKFGIVIPKATIEVRDLDKSVKIDGTDIKVPEKVLEVNNAAPATDIEGPSIDVKTTDIGFSVPRVKGPDIDLSLSKKDVDVTLPEAKAEVKLPDIELKKPSTEVEIKAPEIRVTSKEKEGSPSKFKLPSFKLPKFGVGTPKATMEAPDMDKSVKIDGPDIEIPEEVLEVNIAVPSIDIEGPSIDVKTTETEHEEKGTKFKFPSLGFSVPQVKGPDIDLSLSKKDVDVTLPEAKAEVKLPAIELKKPSTEVEIKAPEIKVTSKDKEGSPSKFKLPSFKLPKFGVGTPKATIEAPDMDKSVKIDGIDVEIPEEVLEVSIAAPSIDIEGPSIDVKTTETEHDEKGTKFKFPSLGFSVPQVKTPDIDLSLSKKDVDVTLPEAKTEVKLPDIELKKPSTEVEIKAPKIKVTSKDKEGSPSKFKLPSFKLPKFGVGTPKATIEGPDMDKSVKIDGPDIEIPEEVLEVSIAAPRIDIEGPSIDVKTTETEHEEKGIKFKFPSLGFSVPQVKTPDIDLSLSKKDVDVTLPEAKAEVKLPDIELKKPSTEVEIKAPEIKVTSKDKEGSPSKFKLPSLKLPKFGVGTPKATIEAPDMDKSVKIDGTDIEVPEEVLEVSIAAPSIDIEGPSIDVKTTETEHEEKGTKFKFPSLGFSVPQVKGPDIDLSLSKKDVDVTLPEAKAEVKLPDIELKKPSTEVEIKAPEIKVTSKDKEGSPSKFKLPPFKLPKFGVGASKATIEAPDMDKSVKIDGLDIEIPEEVLEVSIAAPRIDIEGPSINLTTAEIEHEEKGTKFKFPSLGFSVPQVKGPDIDLSLSKKDVDVTLTEAKAEVKLPDIELKKPSTEVEIKAPEIKVTSKDKEGSPSKFKLPSLKLPKFGVGTPKATIEAPDMDKSVKIDGTDIEVPEEVLEVSIAAPSIDIEGPSIDVKTTETEHEEKGTKFKFPSLGFSVPQVKGPDIDLSLSKKDVDVTLPEAKAEVKLPDIELKKPSTEVEIKAPEIKVTSKDKEGSPSKFKLPPFKLPKFGVGASKATIEAPDMDKSVKIDGLDIEIPEEVLEVSIAAPRIDIEGPSINLTTAEIEHEEKGTKFKFPSLGFSVPQVKGPDIDLSLSKKDVDVTLTEAKAEVKLPDIELKKPSTEVEIKAPEIKVTSKDKEGSPSKFKLPSFKLPKFGVGTPKATIEAPDMDKSVKIDGPNIEVPEEVLEVSIAAPSIDIEGPSIDVKTTETEHEEKGTKFKFPSLGFSVPQVKGPDIDLSLSKKDVDVTLPEAKVEVKLPDIELKKPSAEVEIKAPEIKVTSKDKEGSPSKFKLPSFKLPKFGVGTPKATMEAPDMDKSVKIDGPDIEIPEEVLEVSIAAPSIDIEGPSIDIKMTETEHEEKGTKFKFPSLGFSVPQVKGPDIDLSLSKKDVDVTLPEAKAEVKLPDIELKKPSAEVEIKAPEIKVTSKDKEGSPSKFKLPSFKFPKFGVGTPKATMEAPDMDKSVKIDGPDIEIPEVLEVSIAAPSIDIEGPSIDIKTTETEHKEKGTKFKFPSLGFSVPQVKGPDIDLSLSKKDVDVTLPEAKAEVKLPDIELKKPSTEVEIKAPEIKVTSKEKEGSPSKFKLPSFKFPKFGVGTPKATIEAPDMDKSVKIDGPDIEIPEEVLEVSIAAPSIDIEGPSIDIKTTEMEHEEKGTKFKLPSLGFSVPQVKGPDIDLSLSKKDVDVTLPEAKAEVKLPDIELKKPSTEVEIKAPEIKVTSKDKEGSPSKFKLPSFKLPKFGVGTPKATIEAPDMDKSVKIDGPDIEIPEEVLEVSIAAPSIDIEGPSIDIKTTETEHEEKGTKFKFPSLGFSVPQVKGPDIDLSLSKKDVDVTLPEAKAEVKLPDIELKKPSAEVEIKAPEIKVTSKDKEGSPSKFKLPSFKLPKFGVGTPKATIEAPDMDKSVKIDGTDIEVPEEVLEVSIAAPSIDIEGPSIDVKTTETEHDEKGTKFKFPSLGFSVPQVKGPDIDLSLSKKDVDVTLPEAKAEVKLPDIELKKPSAEVEIKAPEIKVTSKDKEGSPSKFKLPSLKLPKFGVGTPKATIQAPDMDKSVKIDGTDIEIPEEVLAVSIAAPSIDIEGPSIDVKTTETEHEEKGTKFKVPTLGFSVPQVKGPDIDLSLSKKDVDVTLPKAKAEVKLPDIELKKPSTEVEIKAPEIKVTSKDKEGSPSKFKLPSFKLPKFGVGTPKATIEAPDMDKSVKIDGPDIEIPEEVLELSIAAPSIDIEGPSIDIKTTETEHEEKRSKFQLPSLGFPVPQVKGPDIDLSLSKKDVDVTLPEAKAEVKLPDNELKKPSTETEIKAPEIKVTLKDKEGSPSKFKLPSFKLPKFGVGTPKTTIEAPDMDKSVKIDGPDIEVPEEVLEVNIAAPSIDTEGPSIDVKITETEHEEKGTKFKFPSLGFSVPQVKGPDVDLSLSKKAVDVTLPEAKTVTKLPDTELKKHSAEVESKTPEITVDTQDLEGSPSKFKMPSFKLPKFGVGAPKVPTDVPDMGKRVKIDQTDIELSKDVLEINIAAPSIENEGPPIDVKTIETEHDEKSVGFSVPEGAAIDFSSSMKDTDLDAKFKKPRFSLPRFSLSKQSTKEPGADTDLPSSEVSFTEGKVKARKLDTTFKPPETEFDGQETKFQVPQVKEVSISKKEVHTSVDTSVKELSASELDTNIKKSKFSLPRFTFSKSNVKELEVSAELPHVGISLPEEAKIKRSEMEIKAPELEAKQRSTFKLPKFGIAQPKGKEPEDLNASPKDRDIKLSEVTAKVKINDEKLKEYPADLEITDTEVKSTDVGGSLLQFKMPTFGETPYDVSIEPPHAEKTQLKEDVNVTIKGLSIDIKQDVSKGGISDFETSKAESDGGCHGSPSKFKLPSFKMPKLSFGAHVSAENQLEMDRDLKGESKSSKLTMMSLGEMLKTIDVEFDVSKTDKLEENFEASKEDRIVDKLTRKQLEKKQTETKTDQDIARSPEKAGLFKFPKSGLSSPSEVPKVSAKGEQLDEKSPVGETGDEEISPTSSVQSSDAFADISSTVTSEHVGPSLSSPTKVGSSLSSPTKVTVKYSEPSAATELEEMHRNIITSTMRTELISVEPILPEKITILSSGVSSSSEDTLKLESGKIHVITTNIQATPEAQHAKILTAAQIDPFEGLPSRTQANESGSWTVEESQSGNRTVIEKHLLRETSHGRSESKETIVITKQVTRVFDSSEPISGETASSIQRLRETVHSEKMRFFDGTEE
ncbi:uncharacterized protein KZ484_012896 [Pholidichthys leucotaenia]